MGSAMNALGGGEVNIDEAYYRRADDNDSSYEARYNTENFIARVEIVSLESERKNRSSIISGFNVPYNRRDDTTTIEEKIRKRLISGGHGEPRIVRRY